jgi:hypothetical protein
VIEASSSPPPSLLTPAAVLGSHPVATLPPNMTLPPHQTLFQGEVYWTPRTTTTLREFSKRFITSFWKRRQWIWGIIHSINFVIFFFFENLMKKYDYFLLLEIMNNDMMKQSISLIVAKNNFELQSFTSNLLNASEWVQMDLLE